MIHGPWTLDFFVYDLLRKIFFRSFDLASLLSFTFEKNSEVFSLEFDILLASFKLGMLLTNFFCNYFSDVWVKFFEKILSQLGIEQFLKL